MRRNLFTCVLAVLVMLFTGIPAMTQAAESVKASRGVVRVKLQPEVAREVAKSPRLKSASGQITSGVATLDNALNLIAGVNIRPMLPPNPKFAEKRAKFGLDQWYVVTFDERLAPEEIKRKLSNVAGVMRAEVIKPMSLKEGNGSFRKVDISEKAKASAEYPFNDPRLSEQWHYKNYGTKGTQVAGADINLFDAWAKSTGKKDVVVAIIDGGVDYSHEDLQANMHINELEMNGKPGYDDDGNGYIDDIYGYNFCTQGVVYPHSHGTHVAGTVAAVNNNGIGVCGVAGGNGTADSGIRMISVQVFDSRQGSGDADFAEAIIYAAESGASIAQCSWGWAEAGYYEEAVLNAIDYFTEVAGGDSMVGGLMIFAAGNEGQAGDYYPACYPKVVSVAAMSNDLRPTSYSCYGDWVDVIAPGGSLTYGESEGILSTLPNNEYGFNEGTSMATPHVSGIAALVLSEYGNSEFTNEVLRTQLLTSVNDFYGYGDNEKFRGEYGSGYIDAAKALQMSDGSAPEAVSDFSLQAAQDYIEVTWNIPASSDNNVHSHIIYYSTEEFDASSDLSKLKTVVSDTKFASSGDEFTQEINNLTPLTQYYIAMKAVNRWGKASELSPVKTIKTNDGPAMTLDTEHLSFESIGGQQKGEASFTIGNTADGILKWEAAKKSVSIKPSSVSRRVENPVPGAINNSYKGKIGIRPNSSKSSGIVSDDYEVSDYPKMLKYYDTYYAIIGDTDLSLPNSMAQLFWVDPDKYPEGFNLTSIVVSNTYGRNPKIQIYRGPSPIATASLLQEVQYDWFASNNPIALNEQIHFAANESFWIVVHFEGGQDSWTLPVALYDTENYSYVGSYSWMSNDMGKTWVSLKKALAGSTYEPDADRLTWGIIARCDNPDFSEILELNPMKGTVGKGETQEVKASVDGSKLVNGSYNFSVNLNTNQTENSTVKLPVSYKVSGNKANIQTPKVVNFGSLLVGESKTLSVEVFNEGYGAFRSDSYGGSIWLEDIKSSSEHFVGPSNGIYGGVPARTRTSFDITYTPKSSGSHTGRIEVNGANGEKFYVIVRGVATDPSKLVLEPSTVDAGTLDVAEEAKTVTFNVKNEGNYPLEYVFPKFSDKTIDGGSAKLHQYGYSVSSNIEGYYGGFDYSEPQAMTNAVAVQSVFNDNVFLSDAISMGFEFPFYGKNYDKVYITSYGALCFEPNTITLRDPITPESDCIKGMGVISVYGRELNFGANSKVEYAKQDGKFIVKYTDCLGLYQTWGGGTEKGPVSFRIVLSANGDIEMFYDDYTAKEMFQDGCTLFCAITDPNVKDYVEVTSADLAQYDWGWGDYELTDENQRFTKFNDHTAVKFSAPKANFIRSVEPPYGLVTPGESAAITVTVSADETLDAGVTYNDLAIVTNDSRQTLPAVRINAEITGECFAPEAALEKTEINLGDVYRTADVKATVTIKNNGHDNLIVSNVQATGNVALDNITIPFTLEPRMAKDVYVNIPTAESGAVSGTVNFTTSTGDLVANVKANVIGCPGIDLSLEEVYEELLSGTPLHKDVVISNNGDEDLVYSITPNEIVQLDLPASETAQTSYIYSYSDDDANVNFEWEDIETNGLGEFKGLAYYDLHDYTTVELPFSFPFYGKTYNKIYIYNTGFVSFTERHDDNMWPEPPGEFPQGTVYSNIIAPFWGLHSPNQTKTSGTYHYVTDDRVVISWMEYANSMNYDVCYQLIMEKDGKFKFQYKPYSNDGVIFNPFGIAGISNEDASEGIRIPDYMICFNKAVQFAPVTEYTVKPGASETVGMDFVTAKMQGVYESIIKVNTNVPAKEAIEIPVALAIEGVAEPVWPEDISMEHPIGFYDYNDPAMNVWGAYSAQLTLGNSGTAEYPVIIYFECPTTTDPDTNEEYPDFQLYYYGEANSGIGGWDDEWGLLSQSDDTYYDWVPYNGELLQVGKDGLKLMIPMFAESEKYYTPGENNMKLTIYYGDMEADEPSIKEINVKMVVTPTPVIYIESEGLTIDAKDDSSIETASINVMNAGEYKLTYNLTLDPSGEGETDGDYGIGDGGIAWAPKKITAEMLAVNPSLAELSEAKFSKKIKANDNEEDEVTTNEYDLPTNFEFNDAMFYHHVGNTAYTYGSTTTYDIYKAATRFTAPADGFNISHLYTAISAESAKNFGVKFDIVKGYDPDGEEVLGTGKVIIEEQDNPEVGSFYVIALDKPVYLNPNEEFTVVATYSAGSKNPAYICAKDEKVMEGRYQGWIESYGWFDIGVLFNEKYGSLGYIMTCLETQEGQPWVRLLSAEEGSIEPNDVGEIKVEVNAAAARMEKNNKAMLVIKSNDPMNPVVNYPIVLNCNGKPVISAPSAVIAVKENAPVNVPITVSDPDGDNFTISVADAKGYSEMKSVVADATDTAAIITENEDGSYNVANATMPVTVNVEIFADYGTAGQGNLFDITVVDDKNHIADAYVRYDIEFVNRAPEVIEQGEINVAVDQISEILNFEGLFSDPDGDELTYSFSIKENAFVDAFTTDYGVIFCGKAIGKVRATVTATDVNGGTAKNNLTINVSNTDAINDILADNGDGTLSIMQNPVIDWLNASCGFSTSHAVFMLYGANGTVVARQESEVANGDVISMNIADLQAGVYLLVVEYDGNRVVARVVKR